MIAHERTRIETNYALLRRCMDANWRALRGGEGN